MLRIIKIDNDKINKRKFSKFISKNKKYDLIISSAPLSVKGYILTTNIYKVINLLENNKKVIFVYRHFNGYLELLKRLPIIELTILKKISRRRKIIDFLSYNQMEVLQLFFDYLNSKELSIIRNKKANLFIDGKISYCISSLDRIKKINYINRKRFFIILKGEISREELLNLLDKNDVPFKKIIKIKDGFKIKSKNLDLMLDLFSRRMTV